MLKCRDFVLGSSIFINARLGPKCMGHGVRYKVQGAEGAESDLVPLELPDLPQRNRLRPSEMCVAFCTG